MEREKWQKVVEECHRALSSKVQALDALEKYSIKLTEEADHEISQLREKRRIDLEHILDLERQLDSERDWSQHLRIQLAAEVEKANKLQEQLGIEREQFKAALKDLRNQNESEDVRLEDLMWRYHNDARFHAFVERMQADTLEAYKKHHDQ